MRFLTELLHSRAVPLAGKNHRHHGGTAAIAVTICLALFAPLSPAAAAEAPQDISGKDVVTPGDPGLGDALKQAIDAHQYDKALDLLAAEPEVLATEDGYRLQVKLLAVARHTDKALLLLEKHLTHHPNDGWSRFEIAEIQYKHGHGGVAALQYRLALAGDLDDADTALARARLADISQPKSWRYGYGLNLSANSNVDGAADDGRSALTGLPLVLDGNAAKTSTVALSGFGRAEKFTPVSDDMGLRTAVLVAASTGPAKSYDSEAVSAEAGPEWTIGGNTHLSLDARALMQWVSSDPAASGGGFAVHGDTYGDQQLWAGQFSADDISVRYPNSTSGVNTRFDLKRTRFLSASDFWSFSGAFERAGAALLSSPYTSGQARIGRLFKTPWSSLVYVEAMSRLRIYDHDTLQTSARRCDQLDEISFRFSKRNMIFYRGVPFVTVSAARNVSNITTYDYSRVRLDFGITRGF